MSPRASIIITTHNRRAELQQAVGSALAQKVEGGIEVIVIDDGSTDGTSEMVRAHFPTVNLQRFDSSAGLIVRRNFGIRCAAAPIVFSIDDDALFSGESVVAEIVPQFDLPRVGVVAIPFLDVAKGQSVMRQEPPRAAGVFVGPSFIGTAHALRRDLFTRLGGYRESLFHQGEEGDYALRLLAAGFVVRLGRSAPIHHFESPRRDFRRMDLYGRRNNVLFGWHHAPASWLPAYLAATMWNGMKHGFAVGRPRVMLEGLAMGFAGIWRERNSRAPVSPALLSLHRELIRRQAMPYEEVVRRLALMLPGMGAPSPLLDSRNV